MVDSKEIGRAVHGQLELAWKGNEMPMSRCKSLNLGSWVGRHTELVGDEEAGMVVLPLTSPAEQREKLGFGLPGVR